MATTVADLRAEVERNSKKKVRLFNPTTEDFNVKYAGKTYVLKSLESDEFSYRIALHVKKHLVDFLINKREMGYVTPEERQELEKEVEMKL